MFVQFIIEQYAKTQKKKDHQNGLCGKPCALKSKLGTCERTFVEAFSPRVAD